MNLINRFSFSATSFLKCFLAGFIILLGNSSDPYCGAFSNYNKRISCSCSRQQLFNNNYSCATTITTRSNRRTIVAMSEADGQQEESPTGGGSTPGANADDDNDEGEKTTDEEDEEEEETKVEDPPEVKELKERISELESTLTEKKSSLQYNLEKCEEYSKSGYARKVAEMENMKRVRSNIASTSQASATAAVLRDFLPMYDTLNALKESHGDDEFGAKYGELNLQQTFQNLGVTSYSLAPGETVNNFRMKVLESEPSAEQPKDTVLREVAAGLELDGNVIKAASCISSSGSSEDETETEAEAENESENDN